MAGGPVVDVPGTFGALLIGGIIAIMFSGLTWAQCIIYVKLYSKDRRLIKGLVLVVWLLDTLHTIFIALALWFYLITHFGQPLFIDVVPTSLALTIVITAIMTFVVHCFFIYRIFILSKGNYFISCPLLVLDVTRLCLASLTTAKAIELRSLRLFSADYRWSVTTGLALSAVIDVFITGLMCGLLQRSKNQYSSLNNVLDTLILYAFENGVLTTLAALLSLITWITMGNSLVSMATHFVIIKFYANSLLATLNARINLKPGDVDLNGSRSLGFNTSQRSANSQGVLVFGNGSKSRDSSITKGGLSGGDISLDQHHHFGRARKRSSGSTVEHGIEGASKTKSVGLVTLEEEGNATDSKLKIMVNTSTVSTTDEDRDRKKDVEAL